MSTINRLCYLILIYFVYHLIQFAANCCQFPEHWIGNWYQAGVRITVTIERDKISSKGPCLESDGEKYLIEDAGQKSCYRCMVIHEKHHNVLQYKETFCQNRRSLREVCVHMSGDHLLYSLFRDVDEAITCPFNPPYTFSYSRGHGECKYPPSSIDTCTDNTRFLIQYQACPDIHGSESAMEEIECFAMWKESSHRYLVGKVIQEGTTTGVEDLYKCFVLEKLGQTNSKTTALKYPAIIGNTSNSRLVNSDIEYKIAQSGDSTCSGLFSPMEASITMTLKRSSYNWTCKFPPWMTKRRYWHTLDYSQSYSLDGDESNLIVSNITLTNNVGSSKFEDDSKQQIKMTCAEDRRIIEDFAQLVCRYLSVCRQGFVCVTLYKRSEHIIEMQTGSLSKRPEDACTDRYFDSSNTQFITLITPEPETKVCPFFGNFVVNGVSRLLRTTTTITTTTTNNGRGGEAYDEIVNVLEESPPDTNGPDRTPLSSGVDIMSTYTDNLLQDYFQPDERRSWTDDRRRRRRRTGNEATDLLSTRHVKRTGDNSYALSSRSPNSSEIKTTGIVDNRTTVFNVSKSEFTPTTVRNISDESAVDNDRPHYYRRTTTIVRNRRVAVAAAARSNSAKSTTCVLNFNKILFGCRSPDTMEFRSDCPLLSSDIISIYLCHGSWHHNISRNASIHYLVTTPLSRSSKTVRRYCFMYQTNENSSTIQFTSSSDTCHRDLAPGIDGVLTFNITPVYAGQCAGLTTGASRIYRGSNFSICVLIVLNFFLTTRN